MGPAVVSFHFERPPSHFRFYPRAVFGRRTALVPEGETVPRLEGNVARVTARPGHLARYRQVCGFAHDGMLPIAYPHVLAMPLHVAILTHPSFVVRIMGLIHVANEIRQARPMPARDNYRLRSWIEGHREAARGQEFELLTTFEDAAGIVWEEKSTLLARRAAVARQGSGGARQALKYERPGPEVRPALTDIEVPRSVGRRYGWLSGDLNPIHLADRGARIFGFERAVVHGMWSMARTFAALEPPALRPPVQAQVEFKFPLFLPGIATLEQWPRDGRRVFVLKDAESDRPHLAGSTRRD
jgi:acyl dehydratase